MKRGELYRAASLHGDPRRSRVVLVVSRQRFIDSSYSRVMCVPVYTTSGGLATEVRVGPEEGLKHVSALRCDEVTSLNKGQLKAYVGALSPGKLGAVVRALAIALDIRPEDIEDL